MLPTTLLKVEDNILPKIELVQHKIRVKLLPSVENGKTYKVKTAKYQDFALRLKSLMEKEGSPIKTVNQLKDAIEVTYEMARRYTLGIAKPREEKMQILAEKFNVDISYLDHGTGLEPNVTAPFPIAGRLVPVISWVQAGSWTTVDAVPAGTQLDEWLPPNPKCGKNGYGLEVVGESMLPDFRPGDKIYVNPDFQPSELKTGDLVIVSCEGDAEATFKKLIVESGNMYLQPLNPNWPEQTIPLMDGCKLVGKVVGLYRDV
ncbi:peptidase S24 [Acinetobacter sp. ANC 3903]|uniref:LexA family protein n=1 Tax=Acinetobacter sp. ANC 3903 TaxID=1977883 RepID=UPI000A355FCD|nr:S24 family peptidase [Acinetobacter sp. ANC 3903]OTG62813.1 peptidase S24 [Acinetobacter sp. ANC 3903]